MRNDQASNWLVREVADLKQIGDHSTLQKSCLNYVESKMAPLVAYMLAKLDLYNNMDLLLLVQQQEEEEEEGVTGQLVVWLRDMWLWALQHAEFVKLAYDEMRSEDAQRKEFDCKQVMQSVRLPFVWIVINKLSDLCENFFRSSSRGGIVGANDTSKAVFLRTVIGLFESTPHFEYVSLCRSAADFLDLYISDFILLKGDLQNASQIKLIAGNF